MGIDQIEALTIKIFADGADLAGIREMAQRPYISGFTTNPTLMRKAGVTDYRAFAKQCIETVPDRPISFEVFSDDFAEMEAQAREISSWGPNVYVKIPVTNTHREFSGPLISRLTADEIKVNVTALMTSEQVAAVASCLKAGVPSVTSVFAGRIADTGRDPLPIMKRALAILRPVEGAELIWASPRELLNIFQANEMGCHIITVTNDILQKLSGIDKDLSEFSLETVAMFYRDGQAAGYKI